jgi:hypothetical protein
LRSVFLRAKNLKTLDSKSPLPVMLQTRDIKDYAKVAHLCGF